jgi:hypothetical protein
LEGRRVLGEDLVVRQHELYAVIYQFFADFEESSILETWDQTLERRHSTTLMVAKGDIDLETMFDQVGKDNADDLRRQIGQDCAAGEHFIKDGSVFHSRDVNLIDHKRGVRLFDVFSIELREFILVTPSWKTMTKVPVSGYRRVR